MGENTANIQEKLLKTIIKSGKRLLTTTLKKLHESLASWKKNIKKCGVSKNVGGGCSLYNEFSLFLPTSRCRHHITALIRHLLTRQVVDAVCGYKKKNFSFL